MIVSICSFKGGVGKTTTAVHVAAVLNKRAKTLLVDGDLNGSALAWNERGNLRFPVIAESELNEAEAAEYKHIIVDTAARPQPEELKEVCAASDIVIIPSQPDALSIDALIKLVDSLKTINAKNYKVLFTLVQPNSHHAEEAKLFLAEENVPYFHTHITRRVVCTRAALQGTTVEKLKNGGIDSWREFQNLAKEII
jgi:chromosome partitioning protein